ncbi:MAG: GNAT family N-acetyltransferase [Lapillicoccus sp.]
MTDVTVRSLGEEDWPEYKAIRLAALRDSPDAFVASAQDEEGLEEDFWRLRMRRSARLVAVRAEGDGDASGKPVGVVSVGQGKDEEGRVAEIFGLWVAPEARGTGVATKLVEASADRARRDGRTHVSYWVGTDNGRAVAFASGIGFRPTDFRRPMRVTPGNGGEAGDDVEEEIAMVLPLGEDRGRPDVL